jgi:hypothetical protein
MLPAHPMCLSDEAREEYWRLAEAMDDERLEGLDRYYREDVGRGGTTVDVELHFIVTSELANRREQRIRRLKRALWLSTRRGRLVEAVRQWLVRHRLWSSARRRVIEEPKGSWPTLLRCVVLVLQLLFSKSQPSARVVAR